MDEQIFGTTTPEVPKEPANAAEPAVEPDTRFELLAKEIANTNQAVASMADRLGEVFTDAGNQPDPTPVPVAPAAPTPQEQTTDDFLNDLTARGAAVVDERINEGIRKVSDAQFAPVMATMIETAHDGLIASKQNDVDSIWGPGTWNDVIKPELDKELTQLRTLNFQALADKNAIKALVDRHIGINYAALKERDSTYTEEQAAVAKKSRDDLISSLPTGGAPRISLREGEVDGDTQTFFKELFEATGNKIDVKKFEGMRDVSTLKDYLELTAGAK